MVTSFVLVDPVKASSAPFCTNRLSPLIDRIVNFFHSIFDILINLFFLDFSYPGIMAKALMSSGRPTFEAVSDFTVRALVILYVCIIKHDEVVTVVCTAFKVVSWVAGLHNHLPLESLPFIKLLLAQEHLQVIFGLKSDCAALIRTSDGKFAHLNLSASILSQALRVVKVLAGGNTVYIPILVIFVE